MNWMLKRSIRRCKLFFGAIRWLLFYTPVPAQPIKKIETSISFYWVWIRKIVKKKGCPFNPGTYVSNIWITPSLTLYTKQKNIMYLVNNFWYWFSFWSSLWGSSLTIVRSRLNFKTHYVHLENEKQFLLACSPFSYEFLLMINNPKQIFFTARSSVLYIVKNTLTSPIQTAIEQGMNWQLEITFWKTDKDRTL